MSPTNPISRIQKLRDEIQAYRLKAAGASNPETADLYQSIVRDYEDQLRLELEAQKKTKNVLKDK
jgi:hypothetical protein